MSKSGLTLMSEASCATWRRDREVVSTVDIVRHPSEAEQVLRMLPGHLRGLKKLPPEAGM